MTKIMLVEDDNNLREIYEARLLAEGYEIISAKDGEEALAMAVKEKPDLIISDVMMPKISGFDMLDILRSTPETKNTKVIMMTALSQAEDKARADKLGADKYLVKSQVTLEDVAKVARDVLNGEGSPVPAISSTPPPATTVDDTSTTSTAAATDQTSDDTTDQPTDSQLPVSDPSATLNPALAPTTADENATVEGQIKDFVAQTPETVPQAEVPTPEKTGDDIAPVADNSAPTGEPATETTVPAASPSADDAASATTTPQEIEVKSAPEESPISEQSQDEKLAEAVNEIVKSDAPNPEGEEETSGGSVPIANKKVIEPLSDVANSRPDINALLAKEQEKDADKSSSKEEQDTDDAATSKPPTNVPVTSIDSSNETPVVKGEDPNSIAL